MAQAINVFSCSGQGGVVVVAEGQIVPTCPDGMGQWEVVEVPESSVSFLGAPLDEQSYGHLLEVVTGLFVAAFLARFFLRTMAGKR